VEFDHVSFTYPGTDRKAIDDVSFSIGPGQTLAIIGPTGCGKSTLINLILRSYDVSDGSIRVGGKDVRECSQMSLRDSIGYVPQQAILFNGTVRENVNYGDRSSETKEEDILHALDVAQAKDFVEKLPDGLDTDVNQYGRNLSGGQKQRICIARAVCRKPGIFLLDDCFSALDYITDLRLREALRREYSSGIRIIVAQRIGTVMDADKILVLDKGRVAGIGTHEELMDNCELYREIADSQLTGGVGRW
jgi:ATP-binding cassette subfamily B protein